MRLRTRHPRLSAAACRVYGVAIWLYPAEFRRAFGHELVLAFRNRVEDVLDGGGVLDWVGFAVHIGLDWIHTCTTLMTESETPGSGSLLGLGEGDAAHGYINRTTVDVSLACAAAGIVLACVVWYTYVTYVILQQSVR